MPTAALARLLTAGLAVAAVLAPAASPAPASAVSEYASCAEIAAAQPGAPDGTYEITVDDRTVAVWCHDMAGTPLEYLSLPRTGGAYNVSQDSYTVQVTTHYTRVRLNLPTSPGGSFSINPTDDRFATSNGAPQRFWGWAHSCFNLPNDANLDLTGTPFGMSTANLVQTGFGTVTMSADTQVIDIRGAGGWCGGIYAANPFPLTFLHVAPTATSAPADQTVQSGDDATFTASGTGTPSPEISWESSADDGATWTAVPGASGGTLTVADARHALDGTLYRAVVTNTQGSAATAAAQLTVVPAAPTVSDPADVSVASGQDAVFSVTTGGDPEPALQWQTSVDGATWDDVDGAAGLELVLGDVTTADDGLLVRVVATNLAGTVTSGNAELTVDPTAPSVTDPSDVVVVSGQDASFTVEATGDPAPELTWESSADGTTWAPVEGATGGTLVLEAVTTSLDGTRYRAVAVNEAGSATSAAATLVVEGVAPVILTPPSSQTVQEGDDVTFTVSAEGDPAPTYRWQTSSDGQTWTDVVGTTGGSLTLEDVTSEQDGLQVRVIAVNEVGSVTSEPVSLTVRATADPGGPALPVTGGGSVALAGLAAGLLALGSGTLLVARRRPTA